MFNQHRKHRRRTVYYLCVARNFRRKLAWVAILSGIASSSLMQTLLATAMPRIAVDLDAADLYGWVFAAYLIGATLPLPVFAHLADHRSRRSLFLVGLSLYMAGTIAAALAASGSALVMARLIQGTGAAALTPAAMSAISDLAGNKKGRLFGTVGVVQVTFTALGPFLGAWFTEGYGWRIALWAFIPVGCLTAVAATLGLPAHRSASWPQTWRGIDPWEPARSVIANSRLLRLSLSMTLVGAVLMTSTASLPLIVEGIMAQSAADSALVLTPLLMGAGVGSILGGLAAERGRRAPVVIAWISLVAGPAGIAFAAIAQPALFWVAAAALFTGLAVGMLSPILLVQAQEISGSHAQARASGLVQMSRNLGGAVGTALLSLVAGTWLR